MSRNQYILVALAVFALVPRTASAQKTANVNIATTISGVTPPAGTVPDDGFLVRGDGVGEYVPLTEGKVKTVTNLLIVSQQPGTDWSLTTYSLTPAKFVQSSRKAFFDLRYMDPSDGIVPAGYERFFSTPALSVASGAGVPYGNVTVHLIAKCSETSPAVDLRTMAKDAVAFCPGSMRFMDVVGQWYRLSFAPDNFAGVDRFRVVCTGVDTKGCKTWTLTPEASTDPADFSQLGLQRLLRIADGGEIEAVGGLYHLSFSIGLRRL